MSKVTIVTDKGGKILAIGHGHLSEPSMRKSGTKGSGGGLFALPGQKLQELDLPEDLTRLSSFRELHDKVHPHVGRT